jgi:L-alanine-DL-glutamate epimerase-like enolase superfamily enzyme
MRPLMSKPTDIRVVGTRLHFIPVRTRVPLKFGPEVTTSVTVARACVRVADRRGRLADGWGETPLSVQWVWPGALPYEARHATLKDFSARLAKTWAGFPGRGHPMELGADFQEEELALLWRRFNRARTKSRAAEPMPWLAALVCCSPFDLAIHDAFGRLVRRPVYSTYGPTFMNRDLAAHLTPVPGVGVSFRGKFPGDLLVPNPPRRLRAWHLVGGLDLLERAELTGAEPKDGYPVLLRDWIRRDGLKCLKVKLRGDDAAWDYGRLEKVGRIAVQNGVDWLSADFNCTVTEPDYVNELLDRLRDEHPRLHGMILYVEQPFPYELEKHRIDVHSVSARKPLFLDESAHDWRLVRLGRELGWTGVALKTCKTQTGALLSACWARAHGMTLMVQDLTNPMLAQIPHVLLAAHAGTIMGVETNAMQFYPEASQPEALVHPGLFARRGGCVDWSSARGPGFGYRVDEMRRTLPAPAAQFGDW